MQPFTLKGRLKVYKNGKELSFAHGLFQIEAENIIVEVAPPFYTVVGVFIGTLNVSV